MSEVVIWTDFERVNKTHFWSPQKQVYLQPGTRPEDGNRKALIFPKLCVIEKIFIGSRNGSRIL